MDASQNRTFPTGTGLVPVLSTSPWVARMISPEENQVILGNSNGISGPVGYSAYVVYECYGVRKTHASTNLLDMMNDPYSEDGIRRYYSS